MSLHTGGGTGDYLSQTVYPASSGLLSFCFFTKFTSTLAAYKAAYGMGAASDSVNVSSQNAGTPLDFEFKGTFRMGGSAPAVTQDVWYMVAYAASKAASEIDLYAGALFGGAALNHVLLTGTDPEFTTPTLHRLHSNRFPDPMVGDSAGLRIWEGTRLTEAQFETERLSILASLRTNLWGEYALTENGNDTSGNARHWTTNGTVTWTDDPPFESAVVSGTGATGLDEAEVRTLGTQTVIVDVTGTQLIPPYL